MRFSAFLAAVVLAAVPAAAMADGPPVQLVGDPLVGPVNDGSANVTIQVWIANGYGRQILDDNGWHAVFGINRDNSAKEAGDVVVRFASDVCESGWTEKSLVASLEAWFDENAGAPPFFGRGPDGWLWQVTLPITECDCAGAGAVLTYHCANGWVHTTCEEGGGCDSIGDVTVQALNRPTNEKCETDLTGDDVAECDHARLGGWTGTSGGTAATTVVFEPASKWTHNCTDASLAAGTCTATCTANNRTGHDTAITCGVDGISAISPVNDCLDQCGLIDDICDEPGNNAMIRNMRVRQAPNLQLLKRRPADFERSRLPRPPAGPQ